MNNNNSIEYPEIDKQLIESLTATFPVELPKLEQGKEITQFDLGIMYGKQTVIDHIKTVYAIQQQEKDMEE